MVMAADRGDMYDVAPPSGIEAADGVRFVILKNAAAAGCADQP